MNNLTIPAYSEQAAQAVKERLDSLAKVPGSLGKLEELAIRLAGITGRTCPSFPKKSVVLFAADHDITLKGVSATGQEVTEIQVRNFFKGGGTINAFCRNAGASLTVVDVGIKGDVGGGQRFNEAGRVHALPAPVQHFQAFVIKQAAHLGVGELGERRGFHKNGMLAHVRSA